MFIFLEFKSVPVEFQRKNTQDDFSLTWELSYNACNLIRNSFYYFIFSTFSIVLAHSNYGTVATVRLESYRYDCDKYLSLGSAYTTRASFTMNNSSFTFYLTNILTSDGGYFTLTLSSGPSSSNQQSRAALFVYGLLIY